jgi:transposase
MQFRVGVTVRVAPTTRPQIYCLNASPHACEAAILARMVFDPLELPDDVAALKAMLIAANKRVAHAEKRERDLDAEIENLKLTIAKLQHEQFGPSSERARLLDQLELQLGELVEHVAQAAISDEIAANQSSQPTREPARPRRKPARRPLPQHLPRERRVEPAPVMCSCCGGKLRKLGEDITETLERVPAQWKVIQHVREKWTCRVCETITQPPAPSHPIARGRAGPQLLGEVLFGKYGAHLPLNRQSDIYAGEGIDLDVSTLADLGWRVCCDLDAVARCDRDARARCRAHPRRRHDGAGTREKQVPHGPSLGPCP